MPMSGRKLKAALRMKGQKILEWIVTALTLFALNYEQISVFVDPPEIARPSLVPHHGRVEPDNWTRPRQKRGIRPKPGQSFFFVL